jgi:hypothetical protein
VVAKVRQRLSVSKRAAQNFVVERFSLKKLHVVAVKEEYQIRISNNFAALENLYDDVDIKRACKNIIFHKTGTHWIGGWVGCRTSLDMVVKRKISSPRRESNPRTPIV